MLPRPELKRRKGSWLRSDESLGFAGGAPGRPASR